MFSSFDCRFVVRAQRLNLFIFLLNGLFDSERRERRDRTHESRQMFYLLFVNRVQFFFLLLFDGFEFVSLLVEF